ncbi:tetratricopeptide repeat protein [Janthinobacterium sp. LB3P118]|uniref:tetratricopeptide repeat protein n=1 Tax=Janthinobacterium sp. LB3P118 TaxID=3424195 RepID=UPI003F23E354
MLIPFLLPLSVLAQPSPTLLDLQLLAIAARADAPARDPANIAAFAQTRRAAEAGDVVAQLDLARKLQLGVGAPQSTAQSMAWLRKGVAQGDVLAQTILALEFIDGDSSAEEQALAIKWLEAAAEQHFVPAYNALGERLMRVATDDEQRSEAFAWYQRSAREKDTAGMRNLARAHELGLGVKQSDQWAMVWYEWAEWRGKLAEKENK